MNTKTLTPHGSEIIDQYRNFKVGDAVCSVPYFNNKTVRTRGGLRANIGKGSPKEIFEEIQGMAVKHHLAVQTFTNDSLKKFLVDNNIGIDCSAFTYYVLNAEGESNNKGHLDKHISFANSHGIIGKIRCSLRPIENCDVATFVHEKNSQSISLKEIQPGDIITMTTNDPLQSSANTNFSKIETNDRDHILVIHQVEYQNFVPTTIHYSHAVAYPEDGQYGSGIRQGKIEILNLEKNISEQRWIEDGKENVANRIFIRAQKSKTDVRRLNWF